MIYFFHSILRTRLCKTTLYYPFKQEPLHTGYPVLGRGPWSFRGVLVKWAGCKVKYIDEDERLHV